MENVGLSRDARDLYSWLAEATEAVDRTIPALPCKAGCSSCCEGPLFRVTEAEYRAFVSRTPPAELARLRERAAEAYGTHQGALEQLAARWAGAEVPAPEGLPGRCPALDEAGMCEAYAGRPAVSRLYGYGAAQTLAKVLQMCGDDLTRANVMKQAASLKDFTPDTLLPGVKINTSATDFAPISQLQMMRFKGDKWELFGDIISGDAAN